MDDKVKMIYLENGRPVRDNTITLFKRTTDDNITISVIREMTTIFILTYAKSFAKMNLKESEIPISEYNKLMENTINDIDYNKLLTQSRESWSYFKFIIRTILSKFILLNNLDISHKDYCDFKKDIKDQLCTNIDNYLNS